MIKVGKMSMLNKNETWARVLVILLNKLDIKEIALTDKDIQKCVDENPSMFCAQETDDRFVIKLLTHEEAKSTMEKYDVV